MVKSSFFSHTTMDAPIVSHLSKGFQNIGEAATASTINKPHCIISVKTTSAMHR